MSQTQQQTVTRLLNEVAGGRESAARELMPLVYDELRRLAAGHLAAERPGHTLQATALVHEAYIRLVDQTGVEWGDRGRFFAVAAAAMRHILVDHARGRKAAKRGGGRKRVDQALAEHAAAPRGRDELDLVALDAALTRLAGLDERKARLVELRFFGGMTSEEAAGILGISRTTASEEWRLARAWLYRELEGAPS